MLLPHSLEGCELDTLGIAIRDEGEIRVGEGWIHLPIEASDEGRPRGIAAVDNDQLARKRLVALLDPDLPIDVRFAVSVMVGFDAIDGRSTDAIGGLHGRETIR